MKSSIFADISTIRKRRRALTFYGVDNILFNVKVLIRTPLLMSYHIHVFVWWPAEVMNDCSPLCTVFVFKGTSVGYLKDIIWEAEKFMLYTTSSTNIYLEFNIEYSDDFPPAIKNLSQNNKNSNNIIYSQL